MTILNCIWITTFLNINVARFLGAGWIYTHTRGDQKVRGKQLPFLHRLVNKAGITSHNTATHMQLISYNMLNVNPLRALQRSSRQRYVARTGPSYVAFWRFTTQPINLHHFVKVYYAVIAHIVFHAYLTTYLLIFYANFKRFISNGWCSRLKRITVLSKKQSIQLLWTNWLFWHVNSLK